jgi:hypothetical protein
MHRQPSESRDLAIARAAYEAGIADREYSVKAWRGNAELRAIIAEVYKTAAVSSPVRQYGIGDRVVVNTGGEDCEAVIEWDRPPNPALGGCYLVRFPSGTAQWMNEKHLRPIKP